MGVYSSREAAIKNAKVVISRMDSCQGLFDQDGNMNNYNFFRWRTIRRLWPRWCQNLLNDQCAIFCCDQWNLILSFVWSSLVNLPRYADLRGASKLSFGAFVDFLFDKFPPVHKENCKKPDMIQSNEERFDLTIEEVVWTGCICWFKYCNIS